jgi:hypothetical protein
MALVKAIYRDEFIRLFQRVRPDNFSQRGLEHLYDYLETLSEDQRADIEIDIIALCCDYSEGSVYDVCENYSLESIDELEENTIVIMHDQLNAMVLYKLF